jgi:sugar lactone lactonase YvrE
VYIVWASGLLRVDAKTQVLSSVFETPYIAPGLKVSIGEINEMVVGPDGNLYFSDGTDNRIKSYSFASGVVTLLAGNGTVGSTRVGVPAISSPLKYPQSVAVALDGTIYFSTLEPFIFRIAGEDGTVRALSLAPPDRLTPVGDYDIPHSIALDDQGNLFAAQANMSRVLQIALKSGAVSVYAGTGQQQFNGDGIPAVRASLQAPNHLAWTASGNLIISENHRIRSVSSSTRTISTRLGSADAIIDDPRTLAFRVKLREPANSVVAPDGTLYITSSFSNRLVRLGPNGDLVSAAGGGSFARTGSEPGLAARVALGYPQGIWLEGEQVFFSDADNRIVRQLDRVSGFVSNFAVTPKDFNSGSLFLYYAGGLVSDGKYFYLSDPNGGCVWRISRKDQTVEVYAGRFPGNSGPANNGGPERLAAPSGLALDAAGNLYIAEGYMDGKTGRILRVNAADRSVTTVLQNLRQPSGLAFLSADVLCFSESGGHRVGCLNLTLHTSRIVAGTGKAGFSGDRGPAECAQLNRPSGISFDRQGYLYIADTGNQRIRRVRMGVQTARCRSGE